MVEQEPDKRSTAVRPNPLGPLLKPIFLLPLAVTLAAQWADLLGVVEFLADLCRAWLAFWREIWDRLFVWLAQWINLRPTDPQKDMLTLAIMLIGTLGLAPALLRLSPDPVGAPTSLTETLKDGLKMGPKTSRTLCVLLIGLAAAVILWPFINAGQVMIDDVAQTLATTYQDGEARRAALAARSDLSIGEQYELFNLNSRQVVSGVFTTYPHALAALLGGVIAVLGVNYGRQARSHSELKSFGLATVAIVVLLSIGIAIDALVEAVFGFDMAPDLFTSPHNDFSSILFFGCTFLFGFSIGRSALPMVSVVLLVCSILACDVAIGFGLDVWTAAQGRG